MVAPSKGADKSNKVSMLGVGLDSDDGHSRITKGDNFYLVVGSEETHDKMAETAIKVNEQLDTRGKRLEDVSENEFADILHKASNWY